MTLSKNDIQPNDNQHSYDQYKDTQYNDAQNKETHHSDAQDNFTLSITTIRKTQHNDALHNNNNKIC